MLADHLDEASCNSTSEPTNPITPLSLRSSHLFLALPRTALGRPEGERQKSLPYHQPTVTTGSYTAKYSKPLFMPTSCGNREIYDQCYCAGYSRYGAGDA